MPSRDAPQTSVRLLPAAAEALEVLRDRRRYSRDQVVRELLDSYLRVQAPLEVGDRLTHVTAVLRYPPLPPGRNRPDGKVRVPLRLRAGVADAVADLTLRLPGQTRRRGMKHYARSPLAEAIGTSLSLTHPWSVPGLVGLPTVWTHGAATGLWRLTIAATLTPPEQRAVLGEPALLDAEGEDPTALADLLRHGQLAWHHPWRDEVARHLAINLLVGPKGPEHMRILREQADEFEKLRFDLERTLDLDHWALTGAPKTPASGVKGRGGALIWRGRRHLALGRVGAWLASGVNAPHVVSPPRVTIAPPADWTSIQVGPKEQLSEPVAEDVAAGRVLLITTPDKFTAWPYSRQTGEPVPRFDLVSHALPARTPEELVELLLMSKDRHRSVYLLADEAHALGLVDADERDSIIESAAASTRIRMSAILERASTWKSGPRAELEASASDPERFFAIAAEHHQRESIVRPWWEWTPESIVDELHEQTLTDDQLRTVVNRRGLYWRRELEREMELAGRSAAVGYRVEIDEPLYLLSDLADDDDNDDEDEWEDGTVLDLGDLLD